MSRRRLDQYFSPRWATKVLLNYCPIRGPILEPCSGMNDIADPLREVGVVETNDIDPAMPADTHWDATGPELWAGRRWPWVVSNPPFNVAQPIVEHAHAAGIAGIAMLLRLSYLEPCNNRALFLKENPPTNLIVLPRISFTGNGKTDNVTCAWIIWDFLRQMTCPPILVVSKTDIS